ncbi:MAG: type I-E CRISPR-associated protein Cse2/CasB [Limisphaerales bacterium]
MDHLVRLAGRPGERPADRGTLAALRAWSRSGSQHLAYAPLADLFNRSGIGADRLDDPIWTAIPTLFAWHRHHDPSVGGGIGVTLRKVAGDHMESFEAHFRRLLACDGIHELIDVLPRYVRRAESAGVPINFVVLYWDLRRWSQSQESARDVKVRWARDYFTEFAANNESGAEAE